MAALESGRETDRVQQLLAELKAGYGGFTWESELWVEDGPRRSPYRALVLFGLSARTKDALLVEMCRKFFRRFPDAGALAEWREFVAEEAQGIVRAGQLPTVVSMAEAVADGAPREREGLLGIKGVGGKIAECVLAYGWGEEALPLDANCIRVLDRVFGPVNGPVIGPVNGKDGPRRTPAALRDGLKCVYRMYRRQFADLSIGMVDIHEILRLHGQVCCARTPECARCPVSECRSRREPWGGSALIEVAPTIWDDWRELINEPVAI